MARTGNGEYSSGLDEHRGYEFAPRHGLKVGLTVGTSAAAGGGGIGRYCAELRRALRRFVGDVLEVQADKAGPARWVARFSPRLAATVDMSLWNWARIPVAAQGANLVHATSLAVPKTRVPLVVTVHDLAFLDWPSAFTRYGLAFHLRGLQLAGREAATFVVPTLAVKNRLLRQFPWAEDRIFVAPHGVPSFCVSTDTANSRPVPPSSSPTVVEAQLECVSGPQAALPDEYLLALPRGSFARADEILRRPYFLWVGTVEPRKNVGRLLRGFALAFTRPGSIARHDEAIPVKGADPLLVLSGSVGWKLRMEGLASSALWERLDGRVFFLDSPSDEVLAALYKNSLAVVVPSLDEGYGFPVVEGMAFAKPVAASAVPALQEVAGDAALYFDPMSCGQIAEVLLLLYEDEATRTRLSRAASERVRQFTWERSAELHLRAYHAAVELSGTCR